jgi:hypothetical protein
MSQLRPFSSSANLVNLTAPSHSIDLKPGQGVHLRLGAGFRVDDPLFPDRKTQPPFEFDNPVPDGRAYLPTQADLVDASFDVVESTDVSQEARMLSLAFSASYGLASARMAYQRATSELRQKKVVYMMLAVSGQGVFIGQEDVKWSSPPPSEAIDDSTLRFSSFIESHGSHYVKQLTFGMKVITRVSMETSQSSDVSALRAALSASGLVWRVGGEVAQEHRRFLEQTRLEVSGKFIGGTIEPAGSGIIGSLEDLRALVQGLKAEQVRVNSAPIAMELQSYGHTLVKVAPKCAQHFLQVSQGQVAEAPFGVPAGTILPWLPPPSSYVRDLHTNQIVDIIPPEGWAICDERNQTPNLRDRCLWGAGAWDDIGQPVGTNSIADDGSHDHGGWTTHVRGGRQTYDNGDDNNGAWYEHGHAIPSVGNHNHGGDKRPSRLPVVFIIKV